MFAEEASFLCQTGGSRLSALKYQAPQVEYYHDNSDIPEGLGIDFDYEYNMNISCGANSPGASSTAWGRQADKVEAAGAKKKLQKMRFCAGKLARHTWNTISRTR